LVRRYKDMERQLKTISRNSISEALAKVQHYRYLNQAEEAESICRDILTVDPENQMALRQLGLAITDQFRGAISDGFSEAQTCFEKLSSPYERSYYLGILFERRAKAQMRAGHLAHSLLASFDNAMRYFEEAEKIRPQGNDDALLRWNRCLRLIEGLPDSGGESESFDASDAPPIFRD
jgi:tetratricopeptide (TPR) repeat protein